MNNLTIHSKKENKKPDFSNTWVNLEFCRSIFKNKKLGEGFKMTKCDSGSQNFGSIKDALVYLTWSPPFATRFSTMSRPISTLQDPKEFQQEFKQAQEEYEKYAKECYDKLNEKPEKWRSNPPKEKRMGVGRVNYKQRNVDPVSIV